MIRQHIPPAKQQILLKLYSQKKIGYWKHNLPVLFVAPMCNIPDLTWNIMSFSFSHLQCNTILIFLDLNLPITIYSFK